MSNSNNFTSSLEALIIFNPSLCKNEDEDEKKILYYYPKSLDLKKLLNTIGLCEAMCNFAREFTEEPCQFIHTLKTRIALINIESDVWMTLVVNIPISTSKTSQEYLEEEVKDSICESILLHCRQMFFLFLGPTSLIEINSGVEALKKKLSDFYDRYIGNGMLDDYHITDSLTGVHLLPVDQNIYSQTSQFITRLEAKYTDIYASLFLFSNNYVCGTVPKEDLGIIFRYLIITLLPKINIQDMGTGSFTTQNMGKFMICPPEVPKVFLDIHAFITQIYNTPKPCHVLVYRVLQIDIVLFIEINTTLNDQFLSELHHFMGPILTKLSPVMTKEVNKLPLESPHKYLYWNPETLSIKCNLFPTRQIKSDFLPLVPPDIMHLMIDLKNELLFSKVITNGYLIKEFGVKLNSDSWVVCICKKQRQLYLAINKRNYSLVDVSNELRSLMTRDFPTVFTPDNQ